MWYKSDGEVTHYCGGHAEKELNNKPKGTQTVMTLWFHPTDVEDTKVKCRACGSTIDAGEALDITDVGE